MFIENRNITARHQAAPWPRTIVARTEASRSTASVMRRSSRISSRVHSVQRVRPVELLCHSASKRFTAAAHAAVFCDGAASAVMLADSRAACDRPIS